MPRNDDPRFNYRTYERNIFATREELTALSKILLSSETKTLALIGNLIRIIGLLALFIIRKAMHTEELLIGKQIYERNTARENRDDLRRDDLDGRQ